MSELGQVFISNFANTEITVFSDDTIVSFLNENDLRQTIDLGFPISQFTNTQILELSDTTIAEFIEEFSSSVESTTAIPSPESLTRFISLSDNTIGSARDTVIATVADTRIVDLQVGLGIKTTAVVSNVALGFAADPESIESTLSFGDSQLDRNLTAESIDPDVSFSDLNLDRFLSPDSIASTESFENDHKILNNIVFDAGLSPTTTFGISTFELNLILNSIESETSLGVANVFVSIGPEQIQSTEAFGQPAFNNPVHRSLIFKDDTITKLGNNDDVEVASGIVIRSSTARLTGSSVPGTAAGYITVTIDGTDFAMPLFNLEDVQ